MAAEVPGGGRQSSVAGFVELPEYAFGRRVDLMDRVPLACLIRAVVDHRAEPDLLGVGVCRGEAGNERARRAANARAA